MLQKDAFPNSLSSLVRILTTSTRCLSNALRGELRRLFIAVIAFLVTMTNFVAFKIAAIFLNLGFLPYECCDLFLGFEVPNVSGKAIYFLEHHVIRGKGKRRKIAEIISVRSLDYTVF